MEIEYRLAPGDLLAYQGHLAHRPRKLGRKGGLVTSGVVLALAGLLFWFREEVWAFDLISFLTDTALPVIVTILVLVLFGTWWQRRQMAALGPIDIRVAIRDDGLYQIIGPSHTVTAWAGIEGLVLAKRHLFIALPHNQAVTIPRAAFADDAAREAFTTALEAHLPAITAESDAPQRRGRRIGLYVTGGLASVLVAILLFTWFDPLTRSLDLGESWGSVPYRVTYVGGAQADERLPMVLLLHPLGGFPTIGVISARRFDFKARIVVPSGERFHLIGRSWFSFPDDWDSFLGEIRRASDRTAAFTRAVTQRYPTAGKPIVTGFSQGGSTAWALAAYHPEHFAAAIPAAGTFAGGIPKRDAPPRLPVRAFHGRDDKVVPHEWAEGSLKEFREAGYDVTLTSFDDIGHAIDDHFRKPWHAEIARRVEAAAKAAP